MAFEVSVAAGSRRCLLVLILLCTHCISLCTSHRWLRCSIRPLVLKALLPQGHIAIKRPQLIKVLSSLQCHLSSRVVSQVFRALDHNNDNRISYLEFTSLCFQSDMDNGQLEGEVAQRMLQRVTTGVSVMAAGVSAGATAVVVGAYAEVVCPAELGADRVMRIEFNGSQFDVAVPEDVKVGEAFVVGPF